MADSKPNRSQSTVISAKTLKMIDQAMANFKKGRVSKPIDLSKHAKKVRKSSK